VPDLCAILSIYQGTAGIVPQRDSDGRGYVHIRSRFFRALNRRFHAADFWVEHVAADKRPAWFGLGPIPPGMRPVYADGRTVTADAVQTTNDMFAGDFIERDISSSQTQVLAAFLGLGELEEVASRTKPKFKEYLAERLWVLHERVHILAPGYSPHDARLVRFIKEHWMRYGYGSLPGTIARDLAKPTNQVVYGPGWNTDLTKLGGVAKVERYWRMFLAALPAWGQSVTHFLDVCRDIGRNVD